MKGKLLLSTGAFLALYACQPVNPAVEADIQAVNPSTIRVGPIRHDSLTSRQLARITRIQQVFADVYPSSLEQTIDNFQRDAHPDGELAVRETMATAYEQYVRSQPQLVSLAQKKKEVFALLLSRSMMSSQEAIAQTNLLVLSKAEAEKVLGYYAGKSAPVVVN